MEKQQKKDIHLIGMEDGYELGKVLPSGGLASRIVIARFLKEKTNAYKLGLMKGIEQRKEKAIKSRQALLSNGKLAEDSLTNFKIGYEPDHDLEL